MKTVIATALLAVTVIASPAFARTASHNAAIRCIRAANISVPIRTRRSSSTWSVNSIRVTAATEA